VIVIKINKRLLALALVAAVLIVGAATIVSLTGNDKPSVTTNPTDMVQRPHRTPVTPVTTISDVPASSSDSQTPPTETDQPTNDTVPGNNGNGNGNGNDNNNGTGDAKAHGLERAIEVHERNIAKHANSIANAHANAHADPNHGLQNSLAKLNENLDKMTEKQDQDNLESQSHGNANGHK
jgi:uncharacterized protein YceK